MSTKLDIFNKKHVKENMPDIHSGDIIQVHQKVKEGDKERIQIFEGLVLARKHGKGTNSMITVRKVAQGVGVERVFPVHSPSIEKIVIVKEGKVRRAKLYYVRHAKGKHAKMKYKDLAVAVAEEPESVVTEEEKPAEAAVKE